MEFKIRNRVEKKDGIYLQEARVNIEVTPELRKVVRNHYKKNRCTNKLLLRFISEGINPYFNKLFPCKK